MMASAAELEELAEQMYASPEACVRQQAYQRLNALNAEGSDPSAFYTVLRQSSNQYCLLFAAQGVVGWLKNNLKHASLDVIRGLIIVEVGDCLRRIAQGCAPRHVLTSMLTAYAKLTKLTFDKEPYLLEAVEFAVGLLQSQSWFSDSGSPLPDENSSRTQRLLGLTLLDTLVNEFSKYDSSKSRTFMSFSTHRRCSNNFRDECLLIIFKASLNALEGLAQNHSSGVNSNNLQLMEATVELVKDCLCFDFMAIVVDETEETVSTQFPSSWKDVLFAESTHQILWGQHAALPYPLCATLLTGLASLCGLRRTFFDDTAERVRYIDMMLMQLVATRQLPDGRLRIPHYANLYAEACLRFVAPFGYRDLHQSAWFTQWTEVVQQITLEMFAVPFGSEGSFTTTSNFLTFWARLVNSRHMYVACEEETTKDLEILVPPLALAFFQFRIPAPFETDQKPTGQSSFEEEDYAGALEMVLSQAESFACLVALNVKSTVELLAAYATQQLGPRVLEDSSATAWLFFLAGGLVRHVLPHLEDAAVSACADFIMFCVDCANHRRLAATADASSSTSLPPSRPGSLFGNFVERGLLHFITNIGIVLASKHSPSALNSVAINVFQSQTQLLQFILLNCGHNMLRDGSNDEGTAEIMRMSIDLIGETLRDVPASMLGSLSFDLPPVVELLLAQSVRTYKLRTNLYTVLWPLACKGSYNVDSLQNFLRPIVNCIQNTLSGSPVGMDPLFIAGWMRDLRGVVRALHSSSLATAGVDFMEWFCEKAETFQIILASPPGESPLVVRSFLRLMIEIVNNCSSGSGVLGCSNHCIVGLILFKQLCNFIQTIVERSITDEHVQAVTIPNSDRPSDKAYDLMLKPLALAMNCLRRCIAENAVPLGAMWYYNDDTYDATLLGLLRMLVVFPSQLFKEYAKMSYAIVELLRAVTECDGYPPLAKLSVENLQAILSFVLFLCEDVDVQTGTLLHGLTFLSFIAGFVRDVKALTLSPALRSSHTSDRNGNLGTPPVPMQAPDFYVMPGVGRVSGTPGGSSGSFRRAMRSTRLAREGIARLLESIPQLWQRMLSVAMSVIVCQDRALSISCAVIFPILETHPPFWFEFVEQFVQTYPKHKQQKVREALSVLTNATESQERLFSEVFSFRQMMRAL